MGPYLFDIRGAIKSLKAQGITARRTGRAAVAGRSLPAPEKSGAFEADGTPHAAAVPVRRPRQRRGPLPEQAPR